MILQRRRLPEIRKYQTRIHNTRKRPLYSLTVIMSQVCKQGFDACDGEEDTAEDVEVFGTDEVVDCLRGVVSAEDGGIVGEDIDDAGDGEGSKPEGTDGCEEQGDPFCPELLDEELYQLWTWMEGYTSTTMIAIEMGTMELLRVGAGTAIPDSQFVVLENCELGTGNSRDDTDGGCQDTICHNTTCSV